MQIWIKAHDRQDQPTATRKQKLPPATYDVTRVALPLRWKKTKKIGLISTLFAHCWHIYFDNLDQGQSTHKRIPYSILWYFNTPKKKRAIELRSNNLRTASIHHCRFYQSVVVLAIKGKRIKYASLPSWQKNNKKTVATTYNIIRRWRM